MSNQKPWTLLQVGDKVVFPSGDGGEHSFTVTHVLNGKYLGESARGLTCNPLTYDPNGSTPSWWVRKLRAEMAPLAPWYTKLAVGDTFRNSTGTVFTVVVVREKEIEALWKGSVSGMTNRSTISLKEDSWITKETLATPLRVAALQPPAGPPWYRQLAVGDTFAVDGGAYTVTKVRIDEDGDQELTCVVDGDEEDEEILWPRLDEGWFQEATPLSIAALNPTPPWWHTAQVGDRFSHPVHGDLTVTRVQGDNPPSAIDARMNHAPPTTPHLTFHVVTGGDCALNQTTLISQAQQQPPSTIPGIVAVSEQQREDMAKFLEQCRNPPEPTSPWMSLEVGSPIFLGDGPHIISKVEPLVEVATKLGYYRETSGVNYLTVVVEEGVKPYWWDSHCKEMEKRPWIGLKVGDRVALKDGHVATVEKILRSESLDPSKVEIVFHIEGTDLSSSYYYQAEGALRPAWWNDITAVNPPPAAKPTPYSPSPGDRCYVDGEAWEVTEANLRLGMDDFWQLQMKRIRSATDKTRWNPVQSTTWCKHNLIPASHWSRNLKVGDRILEGGEHETIWTVEKLVDGGEYTVSDQYDNLKTLCPAIDRRWFARAKLLPSKPAPADEDYPAYRARIDAEFRQDIDLRDDSLELPVVNPYRRHQVPTIPLDDLAVGEAVDVPVDRYDVPMLQGIVRLLGKRADKEGRPDKIFGLVSTETTHTIWREM